jgi:hypothetical protein
MNNYSGTVDEAIEHYVLHGGSQADAASGRCDPAVLCKRVKALKEAGAWEHVAGIKAQRAQGGDEAGKAAAGQKRELEMPTPRSLGKAIKSAPPRLGGGRPYGGNGNTWHEYAEGHKLATAAIAEAGVTVPNAKRASARLAEAGVRIGKTTLYEHAKIAPGKTPVRMGDQAADGGRGGHASGERPRARLACASAGAGGSSNASPWSPGMMGLRWAQSVVHAHAIMWLGARLSRTVQSVGPTPIGADFDQTAIALHV